ncbi:hypothetical protein N824_01570 [Pedobacter sp. V48]|nr:hypothetical protein N824_01570 [Pedobacter sp. V48]
MARQNFDKKAAICEFKLWDEPKHNNQTLVLLDRLKIN